MKDWLQNLLCCKFNKLTDTNVYDVCLWRTDDGEKLFVSVCKTCGKIHYRNKIKNKELSNIINKALDELKTHNNLVFSTIKELVEDLLRHHNVSTVEYKPL